MFHMETLSYLNMHACTNSYYKNSTYLRFGCRNIIKYSLHHACCTFSHCYLCIMHVVHFPNVIYVPCMFYIFPMLSMYHACFTFSHCYLCIMHVVHFPNVIYVSCMFYIFPFLSINRHPYRRRLDIKVYTFTLISR